MRGKIVSSPHPRNYPDNLLSCHRIRNPGQHQPAHLDEQGPEPFFDLLILPKRIDNRTCVCLSYRAPDYELTTHIKYVNTHKYV